MMNEPFKQYRELMKSIDQIGELIKPYRQIQELARVHAVEVNKKFAAAARISRVNPAIAAISVSDISKAIADAVKMPEVNKAITTAIGVPNIKKGLNLDKISSHSLAIEDILSPARKIAGQIQNPSLQISKLAAFEQSKVIEVLKQQTDVWRKLVMPNTDATKLFQLTMPQIQEASVAWHSSLTQTINKFQEFHLLTEKPNIAARLLENYRVYTGFVESTIQRISETKNQKIVRALQISLRLAEVQLLTTTQAFSSIITEPTDDDVSEPRPLDLPIIQQDELIAAIESENLEDDAALIKLSPAANVSTLSRHVLFLVTQCNEVVKVGEKSEIFKPTNKVLEVFADFPWLLPETKQSFADFVDCLYFLFYEGAGKDKLRFLKEHGGVLEPADCDLIWCIKHLRNKWLRHDIDHGKEADIRKSWKELSAKFSWLGLQHTPISQEDFRDLHCRVLIETEAFLQKILEKLIKSE
ncbi:MAG: hypothetical protein PUP91_09675 [Rhizonema sp. PD37]|nr:hypothetical protein [Rhizonema sp. PD37]